MDIILIYFSHVLCLQFGSQIFPKTLFKGDGPLDTQVDLHLFCRVSWQFGPGLKHDFFRP